MVRDIRPNDLLWRRYLPRPVPPELHELARVLAADRRQMSAETRAAVENPPAGWEWLPYVLNAWQQPLRASHRFRELARA